MYSLFGFVIVLFLFTTSPLRAEAPPRLAEVTLIAIADARPGAWGMFVQAGRDAECPRQRFNVTEAASGRLLGQSGLLRPGELAVVRLRPGGHVHVHAIGCDHAPALAYPLRVRKASPDHGARAARALAALAG